MAMKVLNPGIISDSRPRANHRLSIIFGAILVPHSDAQGTVSPHVLGFRFVKNHHPPQILNSAAQQNG